MQAGTRCRQDFMPPDDEGPLPAPGLVWGEYSRLPISR
jgi:hypothetical protein